MVWLRVVFASVVGIAVVGSCARHEVDAQRSPAQNEAPAAAPARSAAEPAAGGSPCADLCRNVAPLQCPSQARCAARCNEMSGTPVCQAEMAAVLGCMAAQPATSFECSEEDGGAELREGFCSSQQAAFAACYDMRKSTP